MSIDYTYQTYYWIGPETEIKCLFSTGSAISNTFRFEPNYKYRLFIIPEWSCYTIDKKNYNGKHPYRELENKWANQTDKIGVSDEERSIHYESLTTGGVSSTDGPFPGFAEHKFRLVFENRWNVSVRSEDIEIENLITEDVWRNLQIEKIVD